MNLIKHFVFIFLLLAAAICISSYTLPKKQKKILVFSKTAGYRHTSSIVAGKKIYYRAGTEK
jgi:hypothetical protein